MGTTLSEICGFYGSLFSDYACEDFSNNGLQAEVKSRSSTLRKLAFAVDARQRSIDLAADSDLLVVHHGLSWGSGIKRLDGLAGRRFGSLFRNGTSLYACHLPLDAHREIGNNVSLAKMFGWEAVEWFCECRGLKLGCLCQLPENRSGSSILEDVRTCLAPNARLLDNGREIRRIGIVSGSGGSALPECAALDIDLLLTGEINYPDSIVAEELGVSVICAGHYYTETTGIRALMELTQRTFPSLECKFIPCETDL